MHGAVNETAGIGVLRSFLEAADQMHAAQRIGERRIVEMPVEIAQIGGRCAFPDRLVHA